MQLTQIYDATWRHKTTLNGVNLTACTIVYVLLKTHMG